MKKIIAGTAFLFFGLILYLVLHVQAVEYLTNSLTSWHTEKGKLWSSLDQTHALIPTYIGITFCVVGTILILWGCFEDNVNRLRHKERIKD